MTPDKVESKKMKLGLALSGGGARGFAHPGALKAIEDSGLKPEIISGTSAGALVGILYADGYSPEEIIELFLGRDFREFAEFQVPKAGIFSTRGFSKFLRTNLRSKTFEELNIPVKVVATNLDEGRSVIFDKGPILDPLVASCSIPIVFNPVKINGINYVDGGLFRNFPVSIIRGMCEKLIGVNVSPLIPKKYSMTIPHIAERSYHYMFRANTLLDRNLCDVLVETEEIAEYRTFDLEYAKEIFRIGYQAAQKSLIASVEKNIFSVLCSTEDGNKKILLP